MNARVAIPSISRNSRDLWSKLQSPAADGQVAAVVFSKRSKTATKEYADTSEDRLGRHPRHFSNRALSDWRTTYRNGFNTTYSNGSSAKEGVSSLEYGAAFQSGFTGQGREAAPPENG